MRAFKERIARLLNCDPFSEGLSQILGLPPRQTVGPLISFLYNTRESFRWRAIAALGAVVAAQAQTDLEGARTVMRRLMWSLNDESGGIGWGSAEAIGEICAKSEKLSQEFSKILASYIDPNCNFIENEDLQRGILWGIGRAAQIRPAHLCGAAAHLIPFLESGDPLLRGYAAWAASSIKDPCTEPYLSGLSEDKTPITLFIDGKPMVMRIQELALSG